MRERKKIQSAKLPCKKNDSGMSEKPEELKVSEQTKANLQPDIFMKFHKIRLELDKLIKARHEIEEDIDRILTKVANGQDIH